MKKFQTIIFILLIIVVGLFFVVKFEDGFIHAGLEILSRDPSTSSSPPVGGLDSDRDDILDNIIVTFLDIGQGDATFLRFPNGETMLVDCAKDARVLEALGRVIPFYENSIDTLVVTHPDSDHYGGCIDVMKRFTVHTIVYNGLQKKGDTYWESFWQEIENEQVSGATFVQLERETVWNIASTTVDFLYPDHDVTKNANVPRTTHNEDNNTSVVMKVSVGDQDVLLTGDMETPLEEYLVATYGDALDVEVLKVGHHGSGSSSGQEFLDVVQPDIAIISVGEKNSYGHPSLRVLKRLERAGAEIHRTDQGGDITLTIASSSVFVGE